MSIKISGWVVYFLKAIGYREKFAEYVNLGGNLLPGLQTNGLHRRLRNISTVLKERNG